MNCFVFLRADGVLRPRSGLLALLGLVGGASGGDPARLGAGRVATIAAVLCSCVRR